MFKKLLPRIVGNILARDEPIRPLGPRFLLKRPVAQPTAANVRNLAEHCTSL
jgi:hypothetical protein